jgi:hypothetical protein
VPSAARGASAAIVTAISLPAFAHHIERHLHGLIIQEAGPHLFGDVGRDVGR